MLADVTMRQQMSLQIRSLVETLVADRAFVGRFFHVQDFVHRQSPRLAKAFSAFRALERLFLRMNIPGKIENQR